MDPSDPTKPARAKRRHVALGPVLEARLEAARAARHPPPPYASLVRAALVIGLAALENPAAGVLPAEPLEAA